MFGRSRALLTYHTRHAQLSTDNETAHLTLSPYIEKEDPAGDGSQRDSSANRRWNWKKNSTLSGFFTSEALKGPNQPFTGLGFETVQPHSADDGRISGTILRYAFLTPASAPRKRTDHVTL